MLLSAFIYICSIAGIVSIAQYLIYFFLICLFPQQNLGKKYETTSAIVTGASSGIGRSLAHSLARQGLDVVAVALGDSVLDDFVEEFRKEFPERRVFPVRLNLADPAAVDTLAAELDRLEREDALTPGLLFSNAGFIRNGFFADTPLPVLLAQVDVNARVSVGLVHDFVNRLRSRGARGGVAFTSSPAHLIPGPFAAMYAATKAFVTAFGASIAPELRQDGIDVLVMHPSPVSTAFYAGAANLDTINFFKATGVSPDSIAACYMSSMGRVIVHDQGYFSLAVRLGLSFFQYNLMTQLFSSLLHLLPDYAIAKAEADKAKESAKGKGKKKTK
jgi:short-subunit dehydrogenase